MAMSSVPTPTAAANKQARTRGCSNRLRKVSEPAAARTASSEILCPTTVWRRSHLNDFLAREAASDRCDKAGAEHPDIMQLCCEIYGRLQFLSMHMNFVSLIDLEIGFRQRRRREQPGNRKSCSPTIVSAFPNQIVRAQPSPLRKQSQLLIRDNESLLHASRQVPHLSGGNILHTSPLRLP